MSTSSTTPPAVQAPLSPERLAEIRKRWALVPAGQPYRLTVTNTNRPACTVDALSHAGRDVPALLAEVDRLTSQLAAREEPAAKLAGCLVDRTQELLTVEEAAKRLVPAVPRREVDPDSRAARLARILAHRHSDAQVEVIDGETLTVDVTPRTVGEWDWWTQRFNTPAGETTFRGSYATARGVFGSSVKVLLTGHGVPALFAAERAGGAA